MYIVMSHVKVRGASMLQTPAILTPLPLFATVMFSHAIAERAGGKMLGAGVVLHDASPHIEDMAGKDMYINRQLINKRGACSFFVSKEKNGGDYSSKSLDSPTGMSYQPHATMDCELSIIVRMESAVPLQRIKNELSHARIAGGVVWNHEDIKVSDFETFHEAVRSISSGAWVSDAREVVERRLASGLDPVEAVLGAIPEKGWYVPVTVGYSPITGFAARSGVRLGPSGEQVPHAFAEPVVGLVRLDSVRTVGADRPSLWSHEWASDNNVQFFHIVQS